MLGFIFHRGVVVGLATLATHPQPLPFREGSSKGATEILGAHNLPLLRYRLLRRIDPVLLARARELRNNPTETELAVWHLISRYRPAFTRQHILAPFSIDLACREAKLGVEFDGSQHIANAEQDERRTAYLEAEGWRIIRLWNSEVLSNPEGAVQHILERAAERLDGVYPEPIPSRERRVRKPRWG